MFADSVEDLAREIDAAIPFQWGPEDQKHGMRKFAVRDPNGYLLAFTQPVDEAGLPQECEHA